MGERKTVLATLGAGLLLVSTLLVGVAATPSDAATGCDAPDTTWVGPATPDASASWHEPTNWTNGVPTAASTVCIPDTTTGPVIESDATAASLTLQGGLTVDTSLEVGTLDADGGTLSGGATTVTDSLSGIGLTLSEGAALDQWGTAVLGRWSAQGSRLTVHGDAVLAAGADIDTLGGLFTVAETGSLMFDAPYAWADVTGGFANHGEITVKAGRLEMVGAGVPTIDGAPTQFSDGRFRAAPGALLDLGYTELRDGAHLDGVTVDNIAVPSGSTVTVAGSQMLNTWQSNTAPPSIHGEGDLVLTDGTVVDGARFGDSLTVTVPTGEVVTMGFASVRDQARLQVYGELRQDNGLVLLNDARLDVHGVHRAVLGTAVHYTGTDPGLEVIHPGGQLLADDDAGLIVVTPFVNHGTVDSGSGFFFVGPEAESPASSSGTFRTGAAGTLGLGDSHAGGPQFALDQAVVEGEVEIYGRVRANALRVRGHVSTGPGGATWPPGQLELTGTTTLVNGASIAGDVLVGGRLEADLGPTGTAALSGVEVAGEVVAHSGTLSIPSLAPATLSEGGTLTAGHWVAAPGATLDLPSVATNDAWLELAGPGASFGDGLANLTGIGPNGNLLLGGDDLAVPGRFRNEGVLSLASGSRLEVGGKFRQLATGTLITWLDATGRGLVRAVGPRDLGGDLSVRRGEGYEPPVGTVLGFITSNGREGAGDGFDRVSSPPFGSNGNRKLRVAYDVNHVRLRVDRVG